jgi:hypothetical protein
MSEPYISHDFATAERKAFINQVTPWLRPQEKTRYVAAFFVALLTGRPMPHELRVLTV